MVAVQPEYYRICKQQGFSLLGMGRTQRKRVQRMEIGDRVLFYVNQDMVFGAAASVASTYFEDDSPVWPSPDPEEKFAWRVQIKPDCIMDDQHAIDARFIAPRMEYVKKWAPEQWPLAFQGLLHLIPKKDFGLIEHEMSRGRPRPVVRLGPPDANGHCVLDAMAAEAR
jgi:hypothetical protein